MDTLVHREFCDVCNAEMTALNDFATGGHFYNRGKDFDLCPHCAAAVQRFIKDFMERHRMLQKFFVNLDDVKDQKELGDFEQR